MLLLFENLSVLFIRLVIVCLNNLMFIVVSVGCCVVLGCLVICRWMFCSCVCLVKCIIMLFSSLFRFSILVLSLKVGLFSWVRLFRFWMRFVVLCVLCKVIVISWWFLFWVVLLVQWVLRVLRQVVVVVSGECRLCERLFMFLWWKWFRCCSVFYCCCKVWSIVLMLCVSWLNLLWFLVLGRLSDGFGLFGLVEVMFLRFFCVIWLIDWVSCDSGCVMVVVVQVVSRVVKVIIVSIISKVGWDSVLCNVVMCFLLKVWGCDIRYRQLLMGWLGCMEVCCNGCVVMIMCLFMCLGLLLSIQGMGVLLVVFRIGLMCILKFGVSWVFLVELSMVFCVFSRQSWVLGLQSIRLVRKLLKFLLKCVCMLSRLLCCRIMCFRNVLVWQQVDLCLKCLQVSMMVIIMFSVVNRLVRKIVRVILV